MKLKRIKVREVRPQDVKEVFRHLSVQSMLGLKSLYGRVSQDDVINMLISSAYSYCFMFGARQVAILFFVRTAQNKYNMFLLFTSLISKCYNEIQEEALLEMERIGEAEFNTLVYEGSNTEQRYIEAMGFKQQDGSFVSIEGKKHVMYRK